MITAPVSLLGASNKTSRYIIAHEIIQTHKCIKIENASLIDFYPGVLINFKHEEIRGVKLIYNKNVNGFSIKFAKIFHRDKYEFVLTASRYYNMVLTYVTTILIPNSNSNSYLLAETDIVFINKKSNFVLIVQEQIQQKSPLKWSQHYHYLRKIILYLVKYYSL